jgi:hypothetical protein
VPGGEEPGLPPEGGQRLRRVKQIRHVIGVPVQVLAPQPEPQVTGEGPGAAGHDLEHTFRDRWYGLPARRVRPSSSSGASCSSGSSADWTASARMAGLSTIPPAGGR